MMLLKRMACFILLAMLALALFGCENAGNESVTMYTGHIVNSVCQYDELSDETNVYWYTTLTNNTHYNMKGFSVKFKLLCDGEQVDTQTYYYDKVVKHENEYSGQFRFVASGRITGIECIGWTAESAGFWDTYYLWIIIASIIVGVGAIVYILITVINDVELWEVWDAIKDFAEDYLLLIVLVPMLLSGGTFLIFNWISGLIVLAALAAFVLVALASHGVRGVIELCAFGGSCDLYDDTEDDDDEFDDQAEEIASSVGEKLSPRRRKPKIREVKPTTDTMEELDRLIGLESVKNQLRRIKATLLKNKGSGEPLNLHMCFYGNPGTGKTVVARLMANIFYEIGVLPTNMLVETDRSGLCGRYIGETGPLTHKKVKEAMGGVLFVDEAYTLSSGDSGEDYGAEAIAALLKDMEDYKGKFCVILAGYKDEMEKMIACNPGFDSRINRKIEFPDYTLDEQMQIFDMMLQKKRYTIEDEARALARDLLEIYAKQEKFANARTVRNLLEALVEIQALRTMEDADVSNDDERVIRYEDVDAYMREQGSFGVR